MIKTLDKIIKQESEYGCLAAAGQNRLAQFGIERSQEEIYKDIKLNSTGFSTMEALANYICQTLQNEGRDDIEVLLYHNKEIAKGREEHASGLHYLKQVGEASAESVANLDKLNSLKDSSLKKAKKNGVKAINGGITYSQLKKHLKEKNSCSILGINTEPINKALNVNHPGYGHAILPEQITNNGFMYGEVGREIEEDYMTLPEDLVKKSMYSNGMNFTSGNTEGIILRYKEKGVKYNERIRNI